MIDKFNKFSGDGKNNFSLCLVCTQPKLPLLLYCLYLSIHHLPHPPTSSISNISTEVNISAHEDKNLNQLWELEIII